MGHGGKTILKSFKDTKMYVKEPSAPSKMVANNKGEAPVAISSRIQRLALSGSQEGL